MQPFLFLFHNQASAETGFIGLPTTCLNTKHCLFIYIGVLEWFV